jgi:hypothetical protein
MSSPDPAIAHGDFGHGDFGHGDFGHGDFGHGDFAADESPARGAAPLEPTPPSTTDEPTKAVSSNIRKTPIRASMSNR